MRIPLLFMGLLVLTGVEPCDVGTPTETPTPLDTPTASPTPTATPTATAALDADHDGFTVAEGDCDDDDALTFPGAIEECEGGDNDCDGTVEDERYRPRLCEGGDKDQDGFTAAEGDCDDLAPLIGPGAAEVCGDRVDQDCDGSDQACVDGDGDGFTTAQGDCDDEDATRHPMAIETCDPVQGAGVDEDCDGRVDEGGAWLADDDGDGFGGEGEGRCMPLPGYTVVRGDCDDQDADVYPGARDSRGDGLDEDCGGTDGPDPSVRLEYSTYLSVEEALLAASPGASVWVGPGTYSITETAITQAVALRSTHGPLRTTLDAQGLGPHFDVDGDAGGGLTVDGFTLIGGKEAVGGGHHALGCSGGHLTMIGSLIVGGGESTSSSAIEGLGCEVALLETSIINSAGSALRVEGAAAKLTISGGGFYNNAAHTIKTIAANTTITDVDAGYGGDTAIVVSSATLEIVGSTLHHNRGRGGPGGVLHTSGARSEIHTTTIAHNHGGGAYLSSATAQVEDSKVVQNLGGDAAGGIYMGGNQDEGCVLRRVTFTGNAGVDAGGMRLICSRALLEDVTAQENLSVEGGGGMLAIIERDLVMRGVHFEGNEAAHAAGFYFLGREGSVIEGLTSTGNVTTASGAGGTVNLSADAVIRDSEIWGNLSGSRAGGLYTVEDIRGENLNIHDNVAVDGGGIFLYMSTRVKGVTLKNNRAMGLGGGAYVWTSSSALSDATIEGNWAFEGGGIYGLDWSSLGDVRVVGNGAAHRGGGVYGRNTCTFSRALIAQNQAAQAGGGVYCHTARGTTSYLALVGNAARDGAGMHVASTGSSTFTLRHGVAVDNHASEQGGGIGLASGRLHLESSILAHNEAGLQGPSLFTTGSEVVATGSTLFAEGASGVSGNTNLSDALIADPHLLATPSGSDISDFDLHLGASSPCIDTAIAGESDADGSPGDQGLYGGDGGDTLDMDRDGAAAWFWPGAYDAPPPGFTAADYDRWDL